VTVVGHSIGGVEFVVEGECPGIVVPPGTRARCDVTVALTARASDEPLRPAGTPSFEVNSWAAFVDADRFTLCTKSGIHEPAEMLRVELGRARLEGVLWYRRDWAPPIFVYPADQLLLIHALGVGGGAVMHAAGIGGRDGAILAAGPSGAGKTTMARTAHSVGARVLSDERTVVRRGRDGWILGGTPWPGEGGFADNGTLPLRALVLLEQADRDELVPITPGRALALLYRCHFPPLWDAAAVERTAVNLERLVREVPAFKLLNRRGTDGARLMLQQVGGPG
jgi:hypothetical protein